MTLTELISDSIKTVGENANEEWKVAVMRFVKDICHDKQEFTTDDVWELVDRTELTTKDNRAMGYIMTEAKKNGWCEDTRIVQPSRRKVCHGRKIAVWKSLLYNSL